MKRARPIPRDSGSSVRVIAHRGASAYAPENTEAALRLALRLGARAVECDVQLARDGVPVVCHDANLRRLCGEPVRVADLPARALVRRTVRVAGRTGNRVNLLTLARWLRLLPADVLPVVELKRQSSPAAERNLARAAARVVRADRPGTPATPRAVAVISFSPRLVAAARRALPKATVAPIRDAPFTAAILRRHVRGRARLVVMSRRIASARVVAALRRAGKEVWCYTVDAPAMMRTLLRRGVTGLISNRPDVALRVAARSRRKS
jgi:glycerophosphoryl diester phosphodiesterase